MDGKRGGLQRLFRWARQRPQSSDIDAAYVGTAFGLELAIDEANGSAHLSKPKTPQEDGPAPESARPKPR